MDSRSTVAQFLLDHKHNLTNYTFQRVADETYTSRSTLVRTAKFLGYSGWNAFLKDDIEEVKYLDRTVTGVDTNIPFHAGDSPMQIAGAISSIKAAGIAETLDLMDEAERICIFGISINQFMAEIFQHKMILIGRPVEIFNPSEMKFSSCAMNEKDLAIVISYSGNNVHRNPVSIPGRLKDNHVPIIGITSLGNNMLSQQADIVLHTASREKLYSKIGSCMTEASIMTILDMLYSLYFVRNYDQNFQNKINASIKVEKMRRSSSEGIAESDLVG